MEKLANLTLTTGSGSQVYTLENVDLSNTTATDVRVEGINQGFLDGDSDWHAISNKTNSPITGAECNKTLEELGFSDGDTIRFMAKGGAAATNGMVISGGNTPETALAEARQMLRNVGLTNEKTINSLAPKMTVLDKITQNKITRDKNKRIGQLLANYQVAAITKESDSILTEMDVSNEIRKAWIIFAGNAGLAAKEADLTTEVVNWIKQRCDAAILKMQDQYLNCVMEIQRLNESMKAINVDWLKKMYEDSLRACAESLFRNQQLVVAEVESILQRYGVMTPNRQLN